MTRDDITTKQAKKIYDCLFPTLGFLTQLEERLQKLGLAANDPYFERVAAARDAFHRLTVETHYMTCSFGVGRASREREPSPDGVSPAVRGCAASA